MCARKKSFGWTQCPLAGSAWNCESRIFSSSAPWCSVCKPPSVSLRGDAFQSTNGSFMAYPEKLCWSGLTTWALVWPQWQKNLLRYHLTHWILKENFPGYWYYDAYKHPFHLFCNYTLIIKSAGFLLQFSVASLLTIFYSTCIMYNLIFNNSI